MVQTVLIYSMGEVIGDGLIKLPFIAGLRAAFPDARISWCAAKGETVYAGPLKAVVAGYVDEVILEGPQRRAPARQPAVVQAVRRPQVRPRHRHPGEPAPQRRGSTRRGRPVRLGRSACA
jgi:hypothetical protein